MWEKREKKRRQDNARKEKRRLEKEMTTREIIESVEIYKPNTWKTRRPKDANKWRSVNFLTANMSFFMVSLFSVSSNICGFKAAWEEILRARSYENYNCVYTDRSSKVA